jgi:anti-sigma regulatory factor (Ser/Thr protein kinase)
MAAAERFRAVTLPVDAPDTGRAAREMVAVTLTAWQLPHLADDVRSCVSELVSNVKAHAIPDDRSPLRQPVLTVTLRLWPGWLFVDVADEDSTAPTLPPGEPFAPELAADLPEALLPDHGRGLRIVGMLADHVWWAPRQDGTGKHVFCRFSLAGVAA